MCRFNDATALHHEDAVAIHNGGKTMGDREDGALFGRLPSLLLR